MRIDFQGSEAKGRNGYFRAHHATVEPAPRSGSAGEVWVDVFSRREPSNAAPCRLMLSPEETTMLAHAMLESVRLGALECRCCGARSEDDPWADRTCGNCAIEGHTCCLCGSTQHQGAACPEAPVLDERAL